MAGNTVANPHRLIPRRRCNVLVERDRGEPPMAVSGSITGGAAILGRTRLRSNRSSARTRPYRGCAHAELIRLPVDPRVPLRKSDGISKLVAALSCGLNISKIIDKFTDGARLELTNSLARESEVRTYFFQRSVAPAIHPETQLDNRFKP